jgi:hypothetical protein
MTIEQQWLEVLKQYAEDTRILTKALEAVS